MGVLHIDTTADSMVLHKACEGTEHHLIPESINLHADPKPIISIVLLT